MKHLFLLFSISAIFSCSKIENIQILKKDVVSVKPGIGTDTYFYDFDEVDHYYTKMGFDELIAIKDKKRPTPTDTLITYFLQGNLSIDASILKSITKLGYRKKTISYEMNSRLKEIFKEKVPENENMTYCLTVFKNILIFKKNKNIIGGVNLSYVCGYSTFLGTGANTEWFGKNGEFNELETILKNEN